MPSPILNRVKTKVIRITPFNGNTKDVEIAVPLKYLSNFWRTLEAPLIDCEINLILTWPAIFAVTVVTGAKAFAITDTKLYLPLVTLSLSLCKLKIIRNYYNKYNQDLDEQLIGINARSK